MSKPAWIAFANNTALEINIFSICGTATLFAIILTAYLIYGHLKHWTDGEGQKHIVRIVLMVPVYATASFLAVLLGDYSLFFTLVRDCYEAYVLHQFFSLLEHYLREEAPAQFYSLRHGIDESEETGDILSNIPESQCPIPFFCCTFQPGKRMFLHIKRCSLQYVFFKPLLSGIAIVLQLRGLYHTGSFNIHYGYFWISLLLNLSALLAVYFIFLFYDLIKNFILPYRPLAKLISIKILVFFIFWQAMIVGLLYYNDMIPAFFGWSAERSSETVQNVLVCLEMMLLSLFNLYAFSYKSYRGEPGSHTLDIALTSIQSVLNHGDLVEDTVDAFHPDRLKHAIIKTE